MDRIAPTLRPAGRCRGFQNWSNLAFLHWRVPVEMLRPLIPESLEIDTFDGNAWVGLVPFYMSNVRPAWCPPVPGLSYFCETNVRTYVHHRGDRPGVWFFSLDARNRIAVAIARRFWNLNYFFSRLELSMTQQSTSYRGIRPDGSGAYELEVDMDQDHNNDGWHAEPGSLEHFLAERYLLYTVDRQRNLLCGQVHHTPYPLMNAETRTCNQQLLDINDIPVSGFPDHTLFSRGVQVEIFDLKPVAPPNP